VPIEYIGSGPALDLHVFVTPRDENGGVSPPWGEVKHAGAASGLAVAKTMPVEVRAWGLGGLRSFDVWMTYFDLAGKEWVTSAKYLASGRARVTPTSGSPPSPTARLLATGWASRRSGRHTRKPKVRECDPTG
jgi:hypothetical protein